MENNWHEGIEKVIREPLLFKRKLGIGEDAYKSLSIAGSVREYWDLLGAAGTGTVIAKSTVIASTFFQPAGLMGFLGLATAATPVGWVIFAAIASAGAWYGIDSYYKKARDERVDVIPKFINTPIDVIGVGLFNLLLPLSLKVAMADRNVHESEKECIRSYFIDEWGYDERFYQAGYDLFIENIEKYQTNVLAGRLSEFQKSNPDCNQEFITGELFVFLEEVMNADGIRHDGEIEVIENIADATKPKDTWMKRVKKAFPFGSGDAKPSDERHEPAIHERMLVEIKLKLEKVTKDLAGLTKRVNEEEAETRRAIVPYESMLVEGKIKLDKISKELSELTKRVNDGEPETSRAIVTHERLLVELKVTTNTTRKDLDGLAVQISECKSQIDQLAESGRQLETRIELNESHIELNRKHITWLGILVASTGVIALFALVLAFKQ